MYGFPTRPCRLTAPFSFEFPGNRLGNGKLPEQAFRRPPSGAAPQGRERSRWAGRGSWPACWFHDVRIQEPDERPKRNEKHRPVPVSRCPDCWQFSGEGRPEPHAGWSSAGALLTGHVGAHRPQADLRRPSRWPTRAPRRQGVPACLPCLG